MTNDARVDFVMNDTHLTTNRKDGREKSKSDLFESLLHAVKDTKKNGQKRHGRESSIDSDSLIESLLHLRP